jgi:hypothetical protein
VLFQREAMPFTRRDVLLREIGLREYDRETPDPGFPRVGDGEPEF